MKMTDLEPELVYEAIRDGVADGIFRVATNATQMPTNDFFYMIETGVKKGIEALGRRVNIKVERQDE